MTLDIVPAVTEIAWLLLCALAGVGAMVGLVLFHYRTWDHPGYLFINLLASAVAGFAAQRFFPGEAHLLVTAAALPMAVALVFRLCLRGKYQTPMLFVAPALAGVCFLFMFPLAFEVYLSFHKLNLETLGKWIGSGEIEFVGLENFARVFHFGSGVRESFWTILGRTCVWTAVNVSLQVACGLGLALLLHQRIRGVAIYRTLLLLPWALPQLIAVLAWRQEFHAEVGFVNRLLTLLGEWTTVEVGGQEVSLARLVGLTPQEWWTNPKSLFTSICIVNIWLGIPFMMVVCLSALQAVPRSYYEAASLDGSTRFQQFCMITLPLILPMITPSLILGMIWTFNNVNVVYLMTSQGGGAEGADILVSDLYKQAFVFNRFSFSAAYAVVVFCLLLGFTAIWIKASKVSASTHARPTP